MRYIQHKGKLIPADEYYAQKNTSSAAIHVMEEFTSPIDGTRIADGRQLAAHNKEHGVTDHRDYGPNWFKRKERERAATITGQTKQARNERVDLIRRAFDQHQRG